MLISNKVPLNNKIIDEVYYLIKNVDGITKITEYRSKKLLLDYIESNNLTSKDFMIRLVDESDTYKGDEMVIIKGFITSPLVL